MIDLLQEYLMLSTLFMVYFVTFAEMEIAWLFLFIKMYPRLYDSGQ